MDKVQKQLVDTYFRKRKMATEVGSGMHYKLYELNYQIISGQRDVNDFPRKTAVSILTKYPQWFDKIYKPDTFKDFEIGVILSEQPQLFDRFNPQRLRALDDTAIAIILIKHPEMADKFDLSDFSHWDAAKVVAEQPSLLKLFNVDKFNGYDINTVLEKQPQLVDSFDLNKLGPLEFIQILNAQPELKDKFYPYMYKQNG